MSNEKLYETLINRFIDLIDEIDPDAEDYQKERELIAAYRHRKATENGQLSLLEEAA